MRSSASPDPEEGSAVVEFLALTLLLILPVVWLITAAAQIQAASYAATGAADQAAKVYAAEGSPGQAEAAAAMTLADFRLAPERADVTRTCSGPCEDPGTVVSYTVQVAVPIPAAPQLFGMQPRLMTVSSTASHVRKEPA